MWFWGWFIGLWIVGVNVRRRWGLLDLGGMREQGLHVMTGIGVSSFLITLLVALSLLSEGDSAVVAGLFCAGAAWLAILPAVELIKRASSGSKDSLQAEVARQIEARHSAELAATSRDEADQVVAEARAVMRAADAAHSAAVQHGDAGVKNRFERSVPGPARSAAETTVSEPRPEPSSPAAVVSIESDGTALELPLVQVVPKAKPRKQSARGTSGRAGGATAANAAQSAARQASASAALQPAHPLQRPSGPITLSGALPSSFSGAERSVGGSSALSSTASAVSPALAGSSASSRFSYQPQLVKSRLSSSSSQPATPPAAPAAPVKQHPRPAADPKTPTNEPKLS